MGKRKEDGETVTARISCSVLGNENLSMLFRVPSYVINVLQGRASFGQVLVFCRSLNEPKTDGDRLYR